MHAQGPSDDSWVAPERASHRANPLQPTTDVIKHGKELFHRDCEQCHGKAGRGDGPQSFSLEKHPADLASERVQAQADGAFFWKMTEGRGVMPKATLGDKDKWSVILYIGRSRRCTNGRRGRRCDAPIGAQTDRPCIPGSAGHRAPPRGHAPSAMACYCRALRLNAPQWDQHERRRTSLVQHGQARDGGVPLEDRGAKD